VVAGLSIGLLESFLGGYVSVKYQEFFLFAALALIILVRPEVMGLSRTEPAH
jgi:branched-subunit amino acid ABC-type transport system permease component